MIHQVKRIVKFVKLNKAQRKSTGIIFLDIEKSFDTLWHNGLVYKLNNFGHPMFIQKIVDIDGKRSACRRILAAVPQGSVLSLILYSILTSDYKIPKIST